MCELKVLTSRKLLLAILIGHNIKIVRATCTCYFFLSRYKVICKRLMRKLGHLGRKCIKLMFKKNVLHTQSQKCRFLAARMTESQSFVCVIKKNYIKQ